MYHVGEWFVMQSYYQYLFNVNVNLYYDRRIPNMSEVYVISIFVNTCFSYALYNTV